MSFINTIGTDLTMQSIHNDAEVNLWPLALFVLLPAICAARGRMRECWRFQRTACINPSAPRRLQQPWCMLGVCRMTTARELLSSGEGAVSVLHLVAPGESDSV